MTSLQVTDASDGDLVPRMYSYWSNAVIRNDGTICVFCGHMDGHPRFFFIDIATETVARFGSLVSYMGTSEGWYWDACGWIYLIDGPRLRHVNPFSHEDVMVFDISETHPNCDLWQAHSSDDGQTHSATVRTIVSDGAYPAIGTVVFSNGHHTFFAADSYDLDESAVTSDGAYLIIKSSPLDDNLIINIETGEQRWLRKTEGALGHSDCGSSFMVGADRDHEPRACVKWDLTKPLTMDNRLLLAQSDDWSGGDLGHISVKNGVCIVSDGANISRIGLNGEGKTPLIAHGMIGSDYDHLVQANLDPSGRVACYMSNQGGDRQDVFLLMI